jgi:hypothetical protein
MEIFDAEVDWQSNCLLERQLEPFDVFSFGLIALGGMMVTL